MYDIYIASAVENGGLYHYKCNNQKKLSFVGYTALNKPVYSAIYDNKIYSLSRDYCDGNTGLISNELNNDNSIGNELEIIDTKGVCGCHLCIGNGIYVTNYLSGSVFKVPDTIINHKGHSINPKRQEMPHPHFVCETPDRKYICVVDLGIDKIIVYTHGLEQISEVNIKAGYGPRHMVFSDDGTLAMIACELSSTVETLLYTDGDFTYIDSYNCLPEDFSGESTVAAIRIKNDKLYVSNRGHDSITVFSIVNNKLLKLETVTCCGKSPRDINIVGELLLSANELSDNVTVFVLGEDGKIGKLIEEIKVECPQCITYK